MTIAGKILGLFITTFNAFIRLLAKVLDAIFILLPDSPFKDIDSSPISDFLGYMNYLVPVTEIVAIMTLWCTAIALYYIVQIALRWIKVID